MKGLARPGGNVTGHTSLGGELGGKRLQLLKEALPKLKRVGVLVTTSYSPVSGQDFKMVQDAAVKLRLTLIPVTVNARSELKEAFATMARGGAEAVLLTQSAQFGGVWLKDILQMAAARRWPIMSGNGAAPQSGALLSYGRSLTESLQRVAWMADKILKGRPPSEIPVEQPTRFDFTINAKVAKTLGIKFPQTILIQATRVIE